MKKVKEKYIIINKINKIIYYEIHKNPNKIKYHFILSTEVLY